MLRIKDFKIETEVPAKVRVGGTCRLTGESYSVVVPSEGFARWQAGELIQRSMPEVSAEDREFLISGASPNGWRKTFGPG